MTTMTVRFWGVRGSHPVSGPEYLKYGGNTLCVEVEANGHTIILDAGTGIINLGKSLNARAKASGKPIDVTILFSHMHHDHTQGFPFFTPAYRGDTNMHIFGPGIFERDLEETLAKTMLPPVFPVSMAELPAQKIVSSIRETDVLLLSEAVGGAMLRNRFHDNLSDIDENMIVIKALRSYAHPDGVLVYRIEWQGMSVVYATDTEGYINGDQRLAQFAQGADVLIHDAQYTEEHYLGKAPGFGSTQGWGHSTATMACDVAKSAKVGTLVLFHHEPTYGDDVIETIENHAKSMFAGAVAAREGLELVLNQPQPEVASTDDASTAVTEPLSSDVAS